MVEEQAIAPWWQDVEEDPIHAAAAEWFMRLQDPQISLEDAIAWQRWIAEDERHKQAFARIETTYREMGGMPRPALSSTLAGADHVRGTRAARYDASVPVSDWLQSASRGVKQIRRRSRVASLAAAAALVVVGGTWLVSGDLFEPGDSSQLIQTQVGDNRTASLPDGSKVTLGGATELKVSFDANARQVKLLRGEAFFSVAREASRPFIVRAGDSEVTAIGTQFNVRRRNKQFEVAVVEGRVRVETASALPPGWLRELRPTVQPVQLNAGQRTIVGDAGIGPAESVANPTAVTSWRTGQLAFDREPLRDVLVDVNRYAPRPIVVSDEETGALEITGTVSRSDIGGWVQSLETAFRLEAVEETNQIVIRRKH